MKIRINLFIWSTLFFFLTTSSTWAADTEMPVWLKLDNGSGSTAADASGNGNTGTVSGCIWVAGAPNAVEKETNNYALDLRPAGTLSIRGGCLATVTDKFSLALWLKHDGSFRAPYGGTLGLCYDVPKLNLYLGLPWLSNNQCIFGLHTGWGDQMTFQMQASEYIGSWNHWTFTKNCSKKRMTAYHNGDFKAEIVAYTPVLSGSTAQLRFGNAWVGPFFGMLDDIRIYNIELSEEERYRNAGIGDPKKAYRPFPVNASTDIPYGSSMTLKWKPGEGVSSHNVFFGTKPNVLSTIANGLAKLTTQVIVNNITMGKTYYWRVDEVGTSGTVTGNLWSFSTKQCVVVEDFESYADSTSLRTAWQQSVLCWGYGSLDTVIRHNGGKAMRFEYSNQYPPYKSEVVREFSSNQNWSVDGIKALSLWFRGDNWSPQSIYMKLTDGAATPHTVMIMNPDNETQSTTWKEWNIDLTDESLSGLDLTKIRKISLGIGDGTDPGLLEPEDGLIYVDDMKLYPTRCVAEFGPVCDLNGDCQIDGKDMKTISENWLACSIPYAANCEPMIEKPLENVQAPHGGIITPVPAGGITVDGNLQEWGTVTWYEIKKPYAYYLDGAGIQDVTDIRYAVAWDPLEPNCIYVAAKVKDTMHNFVDVSRDYVASTADIMEFRVEANGTFADDSSWWSTQSKAQMYFFGHKKTSSGTWGAWGQSSPILGYIDMNDPAHNPYALYASSLDPADPCVIWYETKVRTFNHYGGFDNQPTTYRTMAPGVIIGFDIEVGSVMSYGPPVLWGGIFTYPERTTINTVGYLPFMIVNQPTACGDWGYPETDFNNDCKVNLQDFGMMAGEWLVEALWP